ncbi:MAG: ParB/RepB/Spo0J family partition protein [Lachnospiraceae bacterium]|nr:ParB/RepB/Spo0J family partition protein [Lachnospiraceae bacterium]
MAGKKGLALGKGLDAMGIDVLIPNKQKTKEVINTNTINNEENNNSNGEVLIKMSKIEPNKKQPRKQFNEDALLELADSIKQFGVIQPLILQKRDKYYEIIAGERRWRAAKIAGLKEIPAIIKDYSDKEIVEIALIENIQRESLNPIEEAEAYKRLIEEYNLKQDEVAEKVSKSRVTITNSMRLLKLDERVREMLIEEMITTGHARALLAIENKDLQHEVACEVFDNSLSVRDTERLVKKIINKSDEEKNEPVKEDINIEALYKEMEETIKHIMGTKVMIKRKSNNRGKIEIEYYNEDELERIYDMLKRVVNE